MFATARMLVCLLLATFTRVASATPVFINEIHYDNAGSDIAEGVEIAGLAGTDLGGWSLLFYNGSNGSPYMQSTLSGVIDDEQNGFGALGFAISGIQNGSPDGLALLDASDNVIQFLSYEGPLTAISGIAAGSSSIDIGFSESSSTAPGLSLQLAGDGSDYSDFYWREPTLASLGSLNSGQRFTLADTSAEASAVPLPPTLLVLLGGLLAWWFSQTATRFIPSGVSVPQPVARSGARNCRGRMSHPA